LTATLDLASLTVGFLAGHRWREAGLEFVTPARLILHPGCDGALVGELAAARDELEELAALRMENCILRRAKEPREGRDQRP
jgi:hypothetical protein